MFLMNSPLFIKDFCSLNNLRMKKNDTINYLFILLFILLLGFVYLNSRMIDRVEFEGKKAEMEYNIGSKTP